MGDKYAAVIAAYEVYKRWFFGTDVAIMTLSELEPST